MLFTDMMGVYRENHTKHIYYMGTTLSLLKVQQTVYIDTTVPERLKCQCELRRNST